MASPEAKRKLLPKTPANAKRTVMTDKEKAWMTSHRRVLISRMETMSVVDILIERHVLESSSDTYEEIAALSFHQRSKRARTLLDFLEKQSSDAFWSFQAALSATSCSDLALHRDEREDMSAEEQSNRQLPVQATDREQTKGLRESANVRNHSGPSTHQQDNNADLSASDQPADQPARDQSPGDETAGHLSGIGGRHTKVPRVVLQELASLFDDQKQCTCLAIHLQLTENDLMKVINSTSPTEDVAWKVLLKWSQMQAARATCSKLHSALCKSDCSTLAEELSQLLSSYDNEVSQIAQETASGATS